MLLLTLDRVPNERIHSGKRTYTFTLFVTLTHIHTLKLPNSRLSQSSELFCNIITYTARAGLLLRAGEQLCWKNLHNFTTLQIIRKEKKTQTFPVSVAERQVTGSDATCSLVIKRS